MRSHSYRPISPPDGPKDAPQEPSDPEQFLGLRIVDFSQFDGVSGLMAHLLEPNCPVPFWLRVGKATFGITQHNRDAVARGLLIAMEIAALDKERGE